VQDVKGLMSLENPKTSSFSRAPTKTATPKIQLLKLSSKSYAKVTDKYVCNNA